MSENGRGVFHPNVLSLEVRENIFSSTVCECEAKLGSSVFPPSHLTALLSVLLHSSSSSLFALAWSGTSVTLSVLVTLDNAKRGLSRLLRWV